MNIAPNTGQSATGEAQSTASPVLVKHFRQILLWPVHLLGTEAVIREADHAAALALAGDGNPWREIDDEFTGDPGEFQDRHYNEFVSFLPPVQRFLYGQGLGRSVRTGYGESPIRVLRRRDIAALRIAFRPDAPPIELKVVHADLHFFFDIDVATLAVELAAENLPLAAVQEALFQIGRTYPSFWTADGRAGNCPWRAEWLSDTGAVLATSDYESKQKFLSFVCQHRAPRIAAHWEFLLRPLALHHGDHDGPIRYRQLEYYRMPQMAYLAVDDPARLTQDDLVHLALANGSGRQTPENSVTSSRGTVEDRGEFDLYQEKLAGSAGAGTRHFVSPHSFLVVADARDRYFTDASSGYLSRFRHQHFLLFLIAHFHRGTLLMFSDQLAAAVGRLHVADLRTIQAFRVETRKALETFLRFTHRYWFQDLSDQAQIRTLFDLCRRHLRLEQLYSDIRQELQDMSHYLEGEAQRRQNASMIRLTVVTTFGLIGTVSTGILGMNLFDLVDHGAGTKLLIFAVVFVPCLALTLYTVLKSARLWEFLDALSDERKGIREKWRALRRVWRGV